MRSLSSSSSSSIWRTTLKSLEPWMMFGEHLHCFLKSIDYTNNLNTLLITQATPLPPLVSHIVENIDTGHHIGTFGTRKPVYISIGSWSITKGSSGWVLLSSRDWHQQERMLFRDGVGTILSYRIRFLFFIFFLKIMKLNQWNNKKAQTAFFCAVITI